MTREQAIAMLAQHELEQLSADARKDLLADWWSIDADDPEYQEIPEPLRTEMAHSEQPADSANSRYDPLILLALRRSFVGVLNSFIGRRLAEIGHPVIVEGQAETLAQCPCCKYRSLQERGRYEICRVCFWEDDGSNDPDQLSACNRMTLREGRENFSRIGVVSESVRSHILPDGTERYAKGDDR